MAVHWLRGTLEALGSFGLPPRFGLGGGGRVVFLRAQGLRLFLRAGGVGGSATSFEWGIPCAAWRWDLMDSEETSRTWNQSFRKRVLYGHCLRLMSVRAVMGQVVVLIPPLFGGGWRRKASLQRVPIADQT